MVTNTISIADAGQKQWDVIIIGAGPAGGLSAFELARRGLKVLLVEQAKWPRYKVCGSCLSPDALEVLHQVGMRDQLSALGAVSADQFHLASSGQHVRLPLYNGMILSRSTFDAQLVRAAIDRGAHFISETTAEVGDVRGRSRAVQLLRRSIRVEVQGRVVLLCTGLKEHSGESHSSIDERSHLGVGAVSGQAPSFFQAGVIYMAVHRDGYVGQVCTEDGQLNLAAAIRPAAIKAEQGITNVVSGILDASGFPLPVEMESLVWKGTPRLTRYPESVATERLFRLGDAAGYVEPFTGEGIGWALRSALAATPIVEKATREWSADVVQQWKAVHRRQVAKRQWACRVLSRCLRMPTLVQCCVRSLKVVPQLAVPALLVLKRHSRKQVTYT